MLRGRLYNYRFSLFITAFAVAAIVFLLVIPFDLTAQVTVLHKFKAKEPDKQLENILYLAAGVALTQAGFSSTRTGDTENYILLTQYTAAKNEVKIRYTLSGAKTPDHTLATVTVDVPIDNRLDARIAAAVERLLQTADIKAAPSADAEIKGLLPELAPASTGNGTKAVSAGSKKEPAAAKVQEEPAKRRATIARFDSSISAAGLVLFGKATEYFHYGAAGMVTAGVVWPFESWSIAAGAKILAIRVFNDSGVTGGPLYLFTGGPNLQIGTGANKPYRVAVGASGGAAVITVAGGSKILAKTVPYADLGVHTAIGLGKHLSLGGEVSFLVIFDSSALIMAATPALTLKLEL